jgi:N-methylhydantoinase B
LSTPKTVDPLTLAIIEGRLDAYNMELGERMLHQSFAPMTAHLRDLGSVLFDRQGRVISLGTYMPAHTAGADIALKGMLDWIGRENIQPNDLLVGNDPFIVKAGHVPDWAFVRPIYHEGELVFYHMFKTHQYDAGGAFIGGYNPGLFDCHAEGLLIPPIRLIEAGKVDEKAYSVILRNVRGSAVMRADHMLVYTSLQKVEERILSLFTTYGKETMLAACDEIMRRTEEAVRREISAWPAGTYRAERAADRDGTTDRPVWARLALTIDPERGQLIFDFSDSDPQCDFINMTLGRTWVAVVSAVAWTLPSGFPRNQGLLDCLKVITKDGTVLGPKYPATSGGQGPVMGGVVIECSLAALGQAVPERTSAMWTRHLNPLFGGKRRDRIDPRTGSIQYYSVGPFHSDGGNGAIYGYDGTDSLGPYNDAGAVLKGPVEVEEWEMPYRWLSYEFRTDSSGHGRWRGGLGTHIEIMNVADPESWQAHDCALTTGNSDGEKFAPLGLLGGTPGQRHRLGIIRNGKKIRLRTLSSAYLRPGDIVYTLGGGGAGVGDPLERDVEKVREDVMNRCISLGTARRVYGVVMDQETFEVDRKATAQLRERKKDGKGRADA